MISDERKRQLDQEFPGKFVAMMGAEGIKELLKKVDVEALSDEIREQMKTEASQQKKLKFAKRLRVVESFRKSGNKPEWMILDVLPGDSAGVAPAGAARWRPFRHLRSERPLPARHQPQQPPEEADRAACARRHRAQRKAHAAGSRRRAVRQRPPRPRAARRQQPPAEDRSPIRSKASRAASARTCSASASITPAAPSSWSGPS